MEGRRLWPVESGGLEALALGAPPTLSERTEPLEDTPLTIPTRELDRTIPAQEKRIFFGGGATLVVPRNLGTYS